MLRRLNFNYFTFIVPCPYVIITNYIFLHGLAHCGHHQSWVYNYSPIIYTFRKIGDSSLKNVIQHLSELLDYHEYFHWLPSPTSKPQHFSTKWIALPTYSNAYLWSQSIHDSIQVSLIFKSRWIDIDTWIVLAIAISFNLYTTTGIPFHIQR